MSAELLFWGSLAFLAYTYVGYPVLVATLARFVGPDDSNAGSPPDAALPTVTVVIAAHNEAASIGGKLRSIAALDYPPDRVRTVVVSDGSDDGTIDAARSLGADVVELTRRGGKAVALNAGCAAARGDILVMTDARQRLAPASLRALVGRLLDPRVGAVGGELVFVDPTAGVGQSLNAYWAYEKFIRRSEARLGAMIGVSGALYAIRRRDWEPLAPDTLLDDLVVPMRLLRRGLRVVFEPAARAYDRPETELEREKRRKLRTLAGNYQAIVRQPWMLAPWAHRAAWQFWSHKVCRLVAPYALLGAAVGSVAARGPVYDLAALGQAFCYTCALLAGRSPRVAKNRFAAICRVFLEIHVTTVQALPAFIRQRASALWVR